MMTPSSEIDTQIRAADATFNVGRLSEAFVSLMQRNPTLTFLDFETRLRDMSSQTHLVAIPRGRRPPGVDVKFLTKEGGDAPFFLWICLHGEPERDAELAKFGGTPEDNLANLARCGCLSMRRPTSKKSKH